MTEQMLRFESEDERFAVHVSPSAAVVLHRLALAEGNRETGGILVGYYSTDGRTALVTDASPPPPDSRAGPLFFQRGTAGLTAWLDKLWALQPRQYYLGEWHAHRAAVAYPSSQDDWQMRAIGANLRFCCPTPIMLIVAMLAQPQPTLTAFVYERGHRLTLRPVPTNM